MFLKPEGSFCLYLDKGIIHKVALGSCLETEEKLILTLIPSGEVFARENEDDEMEYLPGLHFKVPFEFGGEKAGISFHKNIMAVPFCGSLNLNEFAVAHFDRHEPDFQLLWNNIESDED
jgi:hypothetical protein